jgi:hypothetical protein
MDAYDRVTIKCKCGADAITFKTPLINVPITSEESAAPVDNRLGRNPFCWPSKSGAM